VGRKSFQSNKREKEAEVAGERKARTSHGETQKLHEIGVPADILWCGHSRRLEQILAGMKRLFREWSAAFATLMRAAGIVNLPETYLDDWQHRIYER